MKHATDVRGSALIAGEVTMLRSQADVKFDTGDKEESGCLSSNLAQGLPWVLVPSEASAVEERAARGGASETRRLLCEQGVGLGGKGAPPIGRKSRSCDGAVVESSGRYGKTPALYFQ